MQPLDYRVEGTMQFVEVTGEAEDVRLFAEKYIETIHKEPLIQQQCKDDLEQICYDPSGHHQYHPNVFTRLYYFPNKLLVHPWSSKPSPYFDYIKQMSDQAWEKTVQYLQAGSDID